jgi:hypothetical protein
MIKYEQPPNIDQIREVFPVRPGVLFAFAPHIYNPDRVSITDALMIHEQTHIAQQGKSPKVWWKLYIDDDLFRLHQEFEAHLAELQHYEAVSVNRHERRAIRRAVADRLASPLYGRLLNSRQAMAALKRGYLNEPVQRDASTV